MNKLNYIITIVLFSLIFFISSCSSEDNNIKDIKENSMFVSITNDHNAKKWCTEINFHDEKGKVLTKQQIRTKGDLSYHFFDNERNHYYIFGPGGYFEIDCENILINQLSNEDVNNMVITSESIYYYVNNGYTEKNKYDSRIKSINDDFELELDYHIKDFAYYNGYFYTINSVNSEYEKMYIRKYNQSELVESIEVFDVGSFYQFNDDLYVLTLSYLLELNNNRKFDLVDNDQNEITLSSDAEALYKNDEELILINHTIKASYFYKLNFNGNKAIVEKINTDMMGEVISIVQVSNCEFYVTNKEDEIYSLNLLDGIVDIRKVELDFDKSKNLVVAFSMKKINKETVVY